MSAADLEAWRRAAVAALEAMGPERPEAAVVRLLAEVREPSGASRWLTARLEGGRLRLEGEGAEVPAARAALLELLAGEGPAAPATETEPGLRFSVGPPEPSSPPEPRLEGLASAVEELCVAVGRAGLREAEEAPAVLDAVQLVAERLGPDAAGARRWVGRLRRAVAARDEAAVAGLLLSGFRFAEVARHGGRGDGAVAAWLGEAVGPGGQPVGERELLELGRERLDGLERADLQLRYLLETEGEGSLLTEVGVRGAPGPSAGPCPRLLRVGLGEQGASPWTPRLRPLQYTVALGGLAAHWDAVEAAAQADFEAVLEEFRAARAVLGELAEPVVLLRPARLEGAGEGRPVPVDERGLPLPLLRAGRGEVRALAEAALAGERLRWLLGRLLVRGGRLLLRPVSAGLEREGRRRLLRLR